MRLKVRLNEEEKVKGMINGVTWTMNNEVYFSCDDKSIYKNSPHREEQNKFMDFDSQPTDIDWLGQSKGMNELLAIGLADGCFYLVTKLAQVDKRVGEAHKAAITCLKWSHEGGALATAGEDGQIKTWSKNGNLRSTLVSSESVVYSLCWGPDSESLCYCSDSNLFIKSLQAGQKSQQWKAHDGLVLKVDWNASNNLLVSAGEDCKYKLWDSYGRLLFASQPYDYVINSVSWASNGEYFAVGAYNMVRLCDKTGWTYSYEKTTAGTQFNLGWSADSTMLAGASGCGSLLLGQIIEKSVKNEQWELTLQEDNRISVHDLIQEQHEELHFKETVINMQLGFGFLVVLTQNQCCVYSVSSWTSPHVFEVKESVSNIILSHKYLALVMLNSGINIYTYDGKLQSNPKTPNIKFQFLNSKQICLSQDVMGLIDGTDNKKIIFYDTQNGKRLSFELEHFIEIVDISLNQNEQAQERKIAFIDQNRDLYLSPIVKKDKVKLSCMVDSFMFNEKNDILTAVADERLLVWYYLNALYVDRELMDLCKTSRDSSDIQRMSQILSFTQSTVSIRRKDGGIITLGVSPYPSLLFDLCDKNGWQKAVKLCRYVKEQTLWSCLAAVALYNRELNSAEIALAAIDCADKVQFIIYVKELKSELVRNAALSLYFHKQQEAEQMLVNAKLYYRAVKLNIKLYHWERALDLAINYKVHLDTVLAYRQRYLQRIQKEEWMDKFKQVERQVEIDWANIKANIKIEKDAEAKLR